MGERRPVLRVIAQAVELACIAALVMPPDFWPACKRAVLLGGVVVTRRGSRAFMAAQDRFMDAYRREIDR